MNFKHGNQISRLLAVFALVLVSVSFSWSQDADKGKSLFETHCASCHGINEKLVGPALAGVHERREEAWLIKWIRNSQAMIKAGDPIAVKLFNDNNRAVMNSFEQLSDNEIKDILAYVKTGGSEAAVTSTDGDTISAGNSGAPARSGKSSAWVLAVILLALFIIVVQLFNILKLVADYTGKQIFNANNTNAILMLVFLVLGMAGAIWEFKAHGKYTITEVASEHGVDIDWMFNVTLIITGIVFVITQILLFVYAYIYRSRPGRKAVFFAHNNTLEVVWTVIPAIALTVLVLNGFSMWSKITDKAPEDAHQIEVFAYQFGWKARYPGKDGKLGNHNFNLISGTNELGIGVRTEFDAILEEAKATLDELTKEHDFLSLNTNPTAEEAEEISINKKKLKLAQGHYSRLLSLGKNETFFNGDADDDIIPNEIHIPVNEPVLMKFRARDVIHSAYMPYFRVQMNCVPGMPTQFWFKPTVTTKEMRSKVGDNNFDYYLFCAKICGAAHFNMKIKVVVESKEDYNKWLKAQKPRYNKPSESLPVAEMSAESANQDTKQIVLNNN